MDINKFSTEFFKFQPVPMTEQQSKCMINLILLEKDGNIPEEGKAVLGFTRFNLRGKSKVKTDIGLVLMANNLNKYAKNNVIK